MKIKHQTLQTNKIYSKSNTKSIETINMSEFVNFGIQNDISRRP